MILLRNSLQHVLRKLDMAVFVLVIGVPASTLALVLYIDMVAIEGATELPLTLKSSGWSR